MPEILPPVLINNGQNIVIPSLYEGGNQIGPLFQTGTQGPRGPNIITSTTQSDGTANISILGLTIEDSLILNGENYSYSEDSLQAHRVALNIDELDNTSDADKPISNATQSALNNKSDVGHGHVASDISDFNSVASAAAPVQSVNTRVGAIVLTKSDVGLGNVDNTSDANKPISTATATALSGKVDKVAGKGLSDENYTSAEKSKLAGIADGAEVNVNADWNATSGDAEILNKPTLGSAAAANTTDFATASQGELADSALQPQSVNYVGEYNDGADYSPGDVVLYAGLLYIRVLEPNPGYPPGTVYWEPFTPEIGSPAYDLYVQQSLANKSNVGHGHSSSDITDFSSAVSALAAVKSVNTRVGDIVLSKSDVGLDNVDNTSDADKPISNATQTALNSKVDVIAGKGLSDENYTSAEKSKLSGIAAGAEVNVNADWTATSGDAQILNKPSTVAGYNITDAVATSGAQHIDGVKTFTSSPLVPNLTVDSSSSAAVNKAYVDNAAAGIHVHGEVHVILKNSTLAAASGGTVAYTNGTDGVGAKLTITGGLTVVDALNAAAGPDPDLSIGERVLIAGETNAAWNGIYVITAARELTRATDADTPAKMNGGDFVFVTHGTIHADTGWICSEPVTSVGVSPVIFVQFSGSGAYDAGVGLQRDGTLFSVKTPVGGAIVADSNGINLGASGVTPNTYGSSTQSAVLTVNDKGLVTSASSSTVTPAVGSITGLGSGVATFLASPTSSNLAAAVITDKTGSGALVFGTSPTLSSPTISTALTLNTTTYSYGTGAAAAHRTALSINNVDNTSDLNKPISTATQSALDLKSDISNPVRTTLTGDGSTSVFAINGAGSLTNPSALIVAIDGALQEPSVDYTVSSGNITFTDPLASGAKAVVVSPTNTLQVGELTPSDGSVTSAKLAPNLTLTNPTIIGDLTASGTDNTLPNQIADKDESIITKKDLSAQFLRDYLGSALLFSNGVSSGGSNQFASTHGSLILLGASSIAGIASCQVTVVSPTICKIGTALGSNSAGGGGVISLEQNHLIRWGVLPERNATAFDTIARFRIGDAGVPSTNYFGAARNTCGYSFRITKNPSGNYYDLRLCLVSGRGTISDASNTSPIVITVTSAGHGLQTNDYVEITSVQGNTAANGIWQVTRLTATTFSLNSSVGNGSFTTSSQAGLHKITSNTVTLLPQTYYEIFTIWNTDSSSISLFLNELKETPDLILTGGDKSIPTLYNQTAPVNIFLGSITYNTATSGGATAIMNYNSPMFYKI